MEKYRDKLRLATVVLFCLLNVGFGFYAGQTSMLIGGGAGMAYAAAAAVMGTGS